MTPDKDGPFYLGRSMEEWWEDYVSPEYVDGMESFCSTLLNCYPEYILLGFRESQALCEWNTNLVCQAMPCFGAAFVQKALDLFPTVDNRRQARLVFCIAHTGRQHVPFLIQHLNDPSATVRVAACSGLAEICDDDAAIEFSPTMLQRLKGYFQGPRLNREEIVNVFNAHDAWLGSPEGKGLTKANIVAALLDKLQDDEKAVKLAAVGALHWVLDPLVYSVLGFKGYHAFNDPESNIYDQSAQMPARSVVREHLGSLTQQEVAPLLSALNDADPIVRHRVVEVTQMLQVIGITDGVVIPQLKNERKAFSKPGNIEVEIYDNNQPKLLGRTPAVPLFVQEVQAKCRQLAEASVERLLGVLQDRDIAVRIAAVRTLKKLSSPEQDLGCFLLDSLNDPCRQVRSEALLSIHTAMVYRSATQR
jgi:HEAT repeat protein